MRCLARSAICLSFLLWHCQAYALDFYVAPSGNDTNPGTAGQPFATLTRARDAIRQKKSGGKIDGAVRVLVANGTYRIAEPFTLEPQDSGTKDAPISYQAMPGAKPRLTGGRVLGNWKQAANGLWTTHLPQVADGSWYFEQLFVNGKRAMRARTPNKFYFYFQDVREEILEKGASRRKARQTIKMRSEDFQASLAKLQPNELADVNLQVFHKWDNTRRFLESIDAEHAQLATTGQRMQSWNTWRSNTRFRLENFKAALDISGEWFLARNGTLYYKPLPGEDMTTAYVVAPVAEKLLVIAGSPAAGKFVEHVAFRGLTFQHGQWLTPPGGFEAAQAAAPIDAAVQLDGARHITIEDCDFGHIGRYGVWFRNGVQHCVLRRCHVHDVGAGGVRIGETRIAANENERTHHIELDNNIIRHGGYVFPCAVGVWVGQSSDNRVMHNEIADFFYTGISSGWSWGYAPTLSNRNSFTFNHVHHIGWGVLSDMGGIYTLGRSAGTVVRNNVFHDIYSYSYGGWGLYTDEGSTGILFENNLVYNTKTGGFHQHYGKENVVRNNIFAFSKLYQLQATRTENHRSFTFENNIVYYDTGVLLSGAWETVDYVSGKNCYWRADNQPVTFMKHSLQEWQAKGHEQGSIIADPLFRDPQKHDFTPDANSPAIKQGFQPFDPSQAGVYGAAAWIRQANEVSYPPLEIAPPPPPLAISDDFENTTVGRSPNGATSHLENKGDAITVTDATAASGKQSLKFTDAPGLNFAFNPHLTYDSLTYETGTVHNTFALRVEPGAIVQFDWRDYEGAPYQTGPRFQISGGKLQLPGGRSIEVPHSQWMYFKIEAVLGKPNSRQWTLEVKLPGKRPRLFRHLPWGNPEFKRLTWIGFVSAATRKSTFYLDDFALHALE